ncbi:MAG TPA: septation protein SepH, partial [Dehalococcoidia bacterium]|nr:septation protein SepH [Dehalococcoidia bacterium]
MRQLEVVAVSDDGGYVLLAGDENASRATHAVRIDNRLHAAIRGELDDSDERRESELSPRDIQARLRAGETTEAVAKAAKVPIARVMRYAGPVLSERERIVDQAQAAFLQRSRGPAASTPLGAAVEKRLAGTAGLRPETIVWDARRRDDGAWVVVLNYSARGARSALWLWQPAERALTSLNTLATR